MGVKYTFNNGVLDILKCPRIFDEKTTRKLEKEISVDDITEIRFLDNVNEIKNIYFGDFPNLKKVTLPKKLKTFNYRIFRGSTNIEEVIMPENLSGYLATSCFEECKKLKKITWPKNIKIIPYNTFSSCLSLEEMEISEGVEFLDVRVFYDCKNLKKVTLPSTLKTIEEGCFKNCALEEVVLPEGLETLNRNAFSFCEKLKKLTLPSTLKTIEEECFRSCALEELIIPEGVESLEQAAFIDCKKLKKVILPSTLKNIGWNCFNECESLEEIVIPEGVTYIGQYAFKNCKNLKKIVLPSTLEYISNSCFLGCESLEEIVIPEGVKAIDNNAFVQCSHLKKITLPSTLKKIGQDSFHICGELESIVIPEGVESLGESCFRSCINLKNVVLPSTLKSIPYNCFALCYSLEGIEIPEGVTHIAENAFLDCKDLQKITLPSTLKKIDSSCFVGCKNIEEITIPKDCVPLEAAFLRCEIKVLKVNENGVRSHGAFYDTLVDKLICETEKGEICIDVKNKNLISTKIIGVVTIESGNYGENKKIGYFYKGNYIELNLEKLFKEKANQINNLHRLKHDGIEGPILVHLWASKKKFMPHYTVIQNMPMDDIDLFYKNNNCNKWGELVKLAEMMSDHNKGTLFKLCYALGVFQESGSKRDEAIAFIKEHIIGKMNEYEIHSKFDGLDTFNNKYDPMWAEFFMKYFKENHDFMKYEEILGTVDLIAASYNNFDIVREVYPNKEVNTNREADVLLPSHVLSVVNSRKYEYVDEGNKEFAMKVGVYGYTQEQFEYLQEWFNQGKNIEEKDLKIFISEDKEDENSVTYELLAKDNPLGAVLGNITNCCQVVGGAGQSCVKYGMTMPNSKFMTFNYNKEILGQAWVWYDEKTKVVCLDNIEVPERFLDKIKHSKELQKSFVECLKRMASNFISEMESHGLEVKKVTIGKGYNDIKYILEKNFDNDDKKSKLNSYSGYSDAGSQYIVKKK